VLRFYIAPKIVVIVFLVALVGMLAIDLVVVIAQQRTMITNRIKLAKAAIPFIDAHVHRSRETADTRDTDPLDRTLHDHNISCVYLIGPAGDTGRHALGPNCQQDAERQAASAMPSSQSIAYAGRTWGVFWMQAKTALIGAKLSAVDATAVRAILVVDLKPVYLHLRQMQGYLLIYVMINAVVLTYLGSLRIWKVTGRPIQKLAQRAESYQFSDNSFFHIHPEEGNEITRLSRSLNQMIQRLEADKLALQDSISSLEQANHELSRAQSDIIRAEKLASVGRLAAGIAHEIGNPMGIITGYLELLKRDPLDNDQRNEFLQRAEDELGRVNTIIRQLLDLSRPAREAEETPVSMHRVIEAVTDMLRTQPMMTHISVDMHLDAGNDRVWGNAQSMRQVLLNLMLNAVDALQSQNSRSDDDHHIAISTRNEDAPAAQCLVIDVADDGPGIEAANIPNLFDPFFTTKDPGHGTGLGLSVSYMIIDRAGGKISAANGRDGGTVITISLPIFDDVNPNASEEATHADSA
jgi:two-component system NtrC family sensor kinase